MTAHCSDCGSRFPAGPASNHACMPDLADRLLFVLDGWLGHDDWGMETYPYPDTVKELLDALKHGDDPRALRLMAKQTGMWNPNPTGWRGRTFWKRCPFYLGQEYAKRQARRR